MQSAHWQLNTNDWPTNDLPNCRRMARCLRAAGSEWRRAREWSRSISPNRRPWPVHPGTMWVLHTSFSFLKRYWSDEKKLKFDFTSDVSSHVFMFPYESATNALLDLIQLLQEWLKRLIGTSSFVLFWYHHETIMNPLTNLLHIETCALRSHEQCNVCSATS